jgi:oligopeptidase A
MMNPLLSPARPLPFDQVRPEHIEPAILSLIETSLRALNAIGDSGDATYDGTFGALERATETLEVAMGMVEHLESVESSDELRGAYNRVLPSVSEFYSSITLNEALYQSLSRVETRLSEKSEKLTPTQQRHVDKTMEDFRRHGAQLTSDGKARLREIDRQLSEKTTAFSQNLLDGTNRFELVVGDERLAGLPDFAKTMAKESAEEKGLTGYRLTLQGPSVVPVLTYADDAALREEVWRAFNLRGRAAGDNLPLVVEILRLRRSRAQLLGFKDFADLVTVDRMAKTGKAASDFVEDLRLKTQSAFEHEQDELLAFRRSLEGPSAPKLAPWDVSYYAEKLRKKLYDFDEEQLRPYFSAPRVLKGAFELAEELYGLRIESADLPTWNPSAEAHQLLDSEGRVLGVFYTDLYPRESKRDGAWMHGLLAAVPPLPHVALFCTNSQPPTNDAPSLMSFRDVETIYHEFGHLLHHCLSQVSIRTLSCTRVAQDFVELPSQIMENWCSEKAALDRFAQHYQTGRPIPDELMKGLLSARNFRAATAQMRQLGFAAVDLALHIDFDSETGEDPNQFANRVLQKYSVTELPDEYALIASFSHLFSHPVGYAAGYYSYKWAEVLDADAFSRFKEEGLFNKNTGADFRRSILSRGDSGEPMDLFCEFMGRPPKVEPMLARQGLGASA